MGRVRAPLCPKRAQALTRALRYSARWYKPASCKRLEKRPGLVLCASRDEREGSLSESAPGRLNMSPEQLEEALNSNVVVDFEDREHTYVSDALPRFSNLSDALEDWQLILLEEAYISSSRRKIAVSELAESVMLQREQVLAWLKLRSNMTPDQVETIQAVCIASLEREEKVQRANKKKDAQNAFAALSIEERKKVQKENKMSKLALNTLLKVWAKTRNPSRQQINDIARITKLSPTIVKNWFTNKGGYVKSPQRRRKKKL